MNETVVFYICSIWIKINDMQLMNNWICSDLQNDCGKRTPSIFRLIYSYRLPFHLILISPNQSIRQSFNNENGIEMWITRCIEIVLMNTTGLSCTSGCTKPPSSSILAVTTVCLWRIITKRPCQGGYKV